MMKKSREVLVLAPHRLLLSAGIAVVVASCADFELAGASVVVASDDCADPARCGAWESAIGTSVDAVGTDGELVSSDETRTEEVSGACDGSTPPAECSRDADGDGVPAYYDCNDG